jgi:hypothetical protein
MSKVEVQVTTTQADSELDGVIFIAEIATSVLFAVLYVASTSAYVAYWDMGIRVIVVYSKILCILPLMMAGFSLASFLLDRSLRRFFKLHGFKLLTSYVASMLMVFVLLFALFLYRYSDYPFKRMTLTKTGEAMPTLTLASFQGEAKTIPLSF